MDSRLLIGAAAIGVVALAGKKKRSSGKRGSSVVQKVSPSATLMNPAESMEAMNMAPVDWPTMPLDVPFGAGDPFPAWPTITNHSKKFVISYRSQAGTVGNGSRRFLVDRSGSGKYHVGIDLYGNPDDPIVAMESGTIVNHYHFYHGSYALIVQCDSGLVINYGEVKKNSWREFGFETGSKVQKGHAIARVGLMSGGSHMLHFETYMPPTKTNKRLQEGKDPGPLLNPTYYLLRARFIAHGGGRAFSGIDCEAIGSLNRVIPANLKPIALEDERLGERPGDSVLPELLTDDQWRPEKDRASGP